MLDALWVSSAASSSLTTKEGARKAAMLAVGRPVPVRCRVALHRGTGWGGRHGKMSLGERLWSILARLAPAGDGGDLYRHRMSVRSSSESALSRVGRAERCSGSRPYL